MSTRTIADCKKLIAEAKLPYQIIRINGIHRIVPFVSKPIEPHDRKQSPAVTAPAITDVDALYKTLTIEAEEYAKAVEALQGPNLAGLSDEELAKHMDKPEEHK